MTKLAQHSVSRDQHDQHTASLVGDVQPCLELSLFLGPVAVQSGRHVGHGAYHVGHYPRPLQCKCSACLLLDTTLNLLETQGPVQ
jgi:hypothetical protein